MRVLFIFCVICYAYAQCLINEIIPIAPHITKPLEFSLISVSSLNSNEGNYHDIEVEIDSSPLRQYITSEKQASCFRLLVLIDGFKRFTFDWSWPHSFTLSLRLGTHVIDVGLEKKRETGREMSESDTQWEIMTPFTRIVFDVMPAHFESVTNPIYYNNTNSHLLNHRRLLPPNQALDCSKLTPKDTSKQKYKLVRVALVGPLEMSGQNLLALEQARRLPDLCVKGADELTISTFEVSYFSNAKRGSFVELLNELNVTLYRYEVNFRQPMVDGNKVPALQFLVQSLIKASSFSDLRVDVGDAVRDLIHMFQGFHVLSFMNHESMEINDQVLVECARLAGVLKVLNEPSNLWWGNPPTVLGIDGLILPSAFAANFWRNHKTLNKDYPNLKYHIINPGIDFPWDITLENVSSSDDIKDYEESRKQAFVDKEMVVVGWAGRVESQKAPGVFIRMAAAIKAVFNQNQNIRVCFVVAGGGTLLGNTRKNFTSTTVSEGDIKHDSNIFNTSLTGYRGLGPLPALSHALGLKQGNCFSKRHHFVEKGFTLDDEKGLGDIEFLGSMDHKSMLSVIGGMDMVVHTNVLEETFCMVNTEAMARGVPVVSFGVGGVSEYLDIPLSDASTYGQTATETEVTAASQSDSARGIVVSPPTLAALVGKVALLVEDRNMRRSMSKNSIKFVRDEKDMGNDRMARQYAVLYHQLMNDDDAHQAGVEIHFNPPRIIETDQALSSSSFNWTARLNHRQAMDRLVYSVGGGSNPRAQVAKLMDEASDMLNCPSEVEPIADWILKQPPRVAAPQLIFDAINKASDLITSGKKLKESFCALAELTFRVHSYKVEMFTRVHLQLHHHQGSYKSVCPLAASRSPRLVALVAHSAAGILKLILDRRDKNDVNNDALPSPPPETSSKSIRLYETMLSLLETAISLSPTATDAYSLAARERLGKHAVDTADNWNLAAEWLRRVALLKRPPNITHELLWAPPPMSSTCFVDLAVNDREISLQFPTHSFNNYLKNDIFELDGLGIEDENNIKFPLVNVKIGDLVWCRWSGDLWNGQPRKHVEHFPWFKGTIVGKVDPYESSFFHSAGEFNYYGTQGEDMDLSNTSDLIPSHLFKYEWYHVKAVEYKELISFIVPKHHMMKLDSNISLVDTIELERELDIESNMIKSFCFENVINLRQNASLFIPQCFKQLLTSLLVMRSVELDDYVSAKSPISWTPGDAWLENNKWNKLPFAFTTSSKLRHDAEQFEYLASLLKVFDASTAQLPIASDQVKMMNHFQDIAIAYRELANSWTIMDSLEVEKVMITDMFMVVDRPLTIYNGTSLNILSSLKDKVVYNNARVSFFGHAPALDTFTNNDLVAVSEWNLNENVKHFSSFNPPFDMSGMSAEDLLLKQGWVVIDSVFTSPVVKALTRVCDESTTFFDLKKGYYGAYLSDGFADGLMFQLASIFRQHMPRTIGQEVLTQLWAYKYDSDIAQGIRMHIDQGLYSVNCWLRPDNAIEESHKLNQTGGLRIFPGSQKLAAHKNFRQANRDFRYLQNAIKNMSTERALQNNNSSNSSTYDDGQVHFIDIPHRENRCLLFASDFVHETAPIRFKRGYKNRRINFVMMFGLSRHLQFDTSSVEERIFT